MQRLTGIILIVISAASFGTLAIIGRYAYAAGLNINTLLFLRFGFSAVIMLSWLALRREPLPRGRELTLLAGMGGLGYVAQSFLYLSAIQFASVGLVALLLYLYPVFVAILAMIFHKAPLTRTRLLALVLATAGAALTANPQGGQLPGILMAVGAAAIYAVYIIVGAGVMQKVSPVQSSTVIFTSAAVVFSGLAALSGLQWPQSAEGWWAAIAVSLIATILPVVTFLGGLKRIGPTDASLLSTLEPVVTVVLAAVLLQEAIQPLMVLGGALILGAVLILTLSGETQAA